MLAPTREARSPGYVRRDPTRTLLHELLREHLESFLAELDALPGASLPRFVQRELRRFLECGVLAHGFARVHCRACGRDSLVAFSCKGRGFCPSCGGRRMAATAAHLVDRVLPEVPVRQWVLTLPFPLRLGCAFDRELQGSLRRIFVRAVTSGHARRARARGLPPGALGYRSGAVNVTQRAGGALNLNPHFHALFIDGVFTRESPLAPAVFHELAPPTPADVEWVLARIHSRVERLLEQRAEEGSSDEDRHQGILAWLASASVQGHAATGEHPDRPLPGLFAPEPPASSTAPSRPALVAKGAGFTLHAGVSVPAQRRERLEALCRYVARPALATERLSLDDHGRILYALRHPFGGKTHVVFTPRTLLERLCALIPFPRTHLLTYHGVLAPASSWRDEVVPSPPPRKPAACQAPESADPVALDRRYRWAELMKRTFGFDLLTCECGARREVIACITEREVVRRILRHLGLPDEPPSSTPARAPPLLDFARRPPGDAGGHRQS